MKYDVLNLEGEDDTVPLFDCKKSRLPSVGNGTDFLPTSTLMSILISFILFSDKESGNKNLTLK